MQIAVISDLHLGHGDAADEFGHDDAEFLQFLKHLERNFERVILLGDIWETLATPRLRGQADALVQARWAHREIDKRFRRDQYTYIHGNHDLVAGVVDRVPEQVVIEADGTRMLFTHGHHHDLMIRHARPFAEFCSWVGGWVRRIQLSPLYRVLRHLDNTGVSDDHTRCSFQRWAVGAAHAQAADVVVTGHTHRATSAEHGDRIFMNSGSCSEGNITFLSLDTRLGEFKVNSSW